MPNLNSDRVLQGCLLGGVFASFLGVYLSVSLIGLGVLFALISGYALLVKNPFFLKDHPLFQPTLLLSLMILLSICFARPYAYGKPLEKVGYLLCLFPFTFCFFQFPKAKTTLRDLSLVLAFVLGFLALGQSSGLLRQAPSFLNKHLKPLPGADSLFLATGFTFHHTPFGASLTWLFHLSLANWLLGTRKNFRLIFLLGALASLLGAFASLSRGVWLSLTLSSLLTLTLVSWRKTLTALVFFFLVGLATLSKFPELQNRVQSIRLGSNPERIELWKISWEMFKAAPILGQGYHSFGERLPEFRSTEQLYPGFPREAHNMYLDFLATTGLLGFAAFLFFLGRTGLFLWTAWNTLPIKEERAWVLATLGGFTAFLIAGFFDRHFYMTQTLTCLLIFLSISCSLRWRSLKKAPQL